MANCSCECAVVSLETANFEPEEISKGFSDESSETNEKQDDESRKRKRRKKRMLTGVSRQRRAANARERRRIQGVNHAFVQLKNTLPLAQIDISKIEILRLAVKWIDHLRTLLKDYEERKELLNTKQLETSRPNEFVSLGEDMAPVKHDCLYHQFPDLKNTLWEECIGLHESMGGENEGCIHIRSVRDMGLQGPQTMFSQCCHSAFCQGRKSATPPESPSAHSEPTSTWVRG